MNPSSSRSTLEDGGERSGSIGRHHAGGEHDQVGPQQALSAGGQVLDLDHRPALLVELHTAGVPRRNSTPARRASRYQFS